MNSSIPHQTVYYFAYGSNIHVAQMALRCPTSVFKGKAILEGYRWQINQRGVANVKKTEDGSWVEGLVYSTTAKDRRALDRSEGVSKGFYERQRIEVTLESHPHLENTGTPELAGWLNDNAPEEESEGSKDEVQQIPIMALVYVSSLYAADGSIREEYISRMHKAMHDARVLGISEEFIRGSVMPHLVPKDDEPERKPAQGENQSTAPIHEGSPPKFQHQGPDIVPADRAGGDERKDVTADSQGHSEHPMQQDPDVIIVEEEDTKSTTNDSHIHSGDKEDNHEEGLAV